MKLRPLPNTVVNLRTQEEFDEYNRMCKEAGWYVGLQRRFDECGEQLCVDVEKSACYGSLKYSREAGETILTLPELKAKLSGKDPKADTWTLDAPIYRRGSDWIREDKMCIAGIEYTFDKVCEQEAKFRAFRRAHSRYFPKAK